MVLCNFVDQDPVYIIYFLLNSILTIQNKTILTITFFALLFIPVAINSASAESPYELLLQISDDPTSSWLNPTGVTSDSSGNIYVTAQSDNIIIYDSEGNLIRIIDEFGVFYDPGDIEVDSDGNIFNSRADDSTSRMSVFMNDILIVEDVNYRDPNYGLDIDYNEKIYVSDSALEEIFVYDYAGNLLLQFGGDPDQFSDAADVAVDIDGNIYVVDSNNERIQIFNSTGNFQRVIDLPLEEWQSIDVNTNGDIYVGGYGGGGHVLVLDNQGNTLDSWTEIGNVNDIHIDDSGILYVAVKDNYINVYSVPLLTYCGELESYYNIIHGTNSSDYIFGTVNPDLIFGYEGNDIIVTKTTNNCIYAGDGNDFVYTIRDNNTVYGGSGDDSIFIRTDSSAYGEDGNDMILLSGNLTSNYIVDGGDGTSDVCIADRRNVTITTENCEKFQ